MLKNAYLLAKIGADTAENERHFAENLPEIGNYPAGPLPYVLLPAPRHEQDPQAVEVPAHREEDVELHDAPGGSVHGERANLTRLVLGCIERNFCKIAKVE